MLVLSNWLKLMPIDSAFVLVNRGHILIFYRFFLMHTALENRVWLTFLIAVTKTKAKVTIFRDEIYTSTSIHVTSCTERRTAELISPREADGSMMPPSIIITQPPSPR
jgi:hypothetical protein